MNYSWEYKCNIPSLSSRDSHVIHSYYENPTAEPTLEQATYNCSCGSESESNVVQFRSS